MDAFRPKKWDDFVGQPKLKEKLETFCEAAINACEPLAHILLAGPPGVGKTTLAQLIAEKTCVDFESYIMPVRMELLRRTIQRHYGVLFLDEIHRASTREQEELLPLLEDGYMQLPNGGQIVAPWLTIVGATTEPEKIIPPLYDRFTLKPMFEPYTEDQMNLMIVGMAVSAEIEIPEDTIEVLARASNGIPRNARQLVTAARSLSLTRKEWTVHDVVDLAGLTTDGLSEQHLEYLRAIDTLGGRAGLATLCTMLRLHPKIVTDLERALIEKELITYRSNGRELASNGYVLLRELAA